MLRYIVKPNDYKRVVLNGKSILLTRDSSGVFRALENVCRHRGMELITKDQEQSGNKALFVCPYHSWAYASDGELMNVPFEEGFTNSDDVDLDNRNLIKLPAGERSGTLYVVSHPKPGTSTIWLHRL